MSTEKHNIYIDIYQKELEIIDSFWTFKQENIFDKLKIKTKHLPKSQSYINIDVVEDDEEAVEKRTTCQRCHNIIFRISSQANQTNKQKAINPIDWWQTVRK